MKVTNKRAIELLKELFDDQHEAIYINDDEGGDVCGAYLEKAEALEMAIKALQKEKSQWILCTERLPEEMEKVLVWYEYFSFKRNKIVKTFGIAHVYKNFWCGDVQGVGAKCIAWLPLPNPYNGGGETE